MVVFSEIRLLCQLSPSHTIPTPHQSLWQLYSHALIRYENECQRWGDTVTAFPTTTLLHCSLKDVSNFSTERDIFLWIITITIHSNCYFLIIFGYSFKSFMIGNAGGWNCFLWLTIKYTKIVIPSFKCLWFFFFFVLPLLLCADIREIWRTKLSKLTQYWRLLVMQRLSEITTPLDL